uniref:Uncharacterized protein n=1 Tax=Anguilla anguilla TaxID=7936 RepID=A0A0E9UZ61_ANGAN
MIDFIFPRTQYMPELLENVLFVHRNQNNKSVSSIAFLANQIICQF